jgi:hypothetical protein
MKFDAVFVDSPSGGEVTVELAVNRAFTSRAIRPKLSDWPHGKTMDPALGQSSDGCWFEPNRECIRWHSYPANLTCFLHSSYEVGS